tara:strand:+ start:11699 stop:12172 length:474 start_codon:yes stop_codon:yes gene_type:complete
MKIKLLTIGKTDSHHLEQFIKEYTIRLSHYISFDLEVVPDLKKVKNLSEELQKYKEGEQLLKRINNSDVLILLDEKGKQYSSVDFATFLQKHMNSGIKQLVFAIGGPYGFSTEVRQRANGLIGLSKMTFSHQMVRLFVAEQLYRAFTILRNEPYHHQ